MPLNFQGDEDPAISGGDAQEGGTGGGTPLYFGQPIGYFPLDLENSESVVGAFLESFRAETDLSDHDRGLLIDGMEVMDAQMNAVKDAGGIYFAYGMHPDPQLGFAESYLTVYVREVEIGNPRAVLAGFAEAAAGEPGIKAVSRSEFAGGPAVIAEYERVLPAVSTDRVPTNERVALHQLRAGFSFPDGSRVVVVELTSRHTHLWDSYRNVLLGVADSVRFTDPEPDDQPETTADGAAPGAQGTPGTAPSGGGAENVHDRMSRLLG